MSTHTHVYIASCTVDGGIYHYHLDPTGTLDLVNITAMDSPKYMVIADGKMYIVRNDAASNGSGIQVYELDADGNLTNPSDVMPTMGTEGCHIAVVGDNVYCANYGSGSIIKMPDRLVQHTGKGINPDRQAGPHAHFVGLTPDGNYLLAIDLGVDTVFQYDLDLNLVARTSIPAGHGPRHLVFSDDGRYCFIANELISSVTVCAYRNERLTVLDTVSTLPEGYMDVSYCAAIRWKDDKIYVSNRGHNSVAVMSFADETLTLTSTFDCGGDFPRDMHLCGAFLLCTNQLSDDVTVFKADADGSYALVNTIHVKTPLCVTFG